MNSGIYIIYCIVTGQYYLGSAINLKRRYNDHFKNLRGNKHSCSHLQRAYNKYWEHNFQFLFVEFCEKEKLLEREQ